VIVAILVGALLSWAVASNRDLAVASAVAFLFNELADFAVYQPLREWRWLLAVFVSNVVGLVIEWCCWRCDGG
jgi:queuosine precursor transporter